MKNIKAFILMLLIFILTLTSCFAEHPSPSNVQKFCAIPGDAMMIAEEYVRYTGYFIDASGTMIHILSVPYGTHSMIQIYARDMQMVRLTAKLSIIVKQEGECLLITKMCK